MRKRELLTKIEELEKRVIVLEDIVRNLYGGYPLTNQTIYGYPDYPNYNTTPPGSKIDYAANLRTHSP